MTLHLFWRRRCKGVLHFSPHGLTLHMVHTCSSYTWAALLAFPSPASLSTSPLPQNFSRCTSAVAWQLFAWSGVWWRPCHASGLKFKLLLKSPIFFRRVEHSQASNFLTTGLEPTQLEERIQASLNQYAFVFSAKRKPSCFLYPLPEKNGYSTEQHSHKSVSFFYCANKS